MTPRVVLVAVMLGAVCSSAQDAPRRPNFVVVLVDDLRWDGVSATGHPFVETPAVDQLAREGITFRNAFVTTPLCSPSRASFLTGRYVRSHGIIDNGRSASFDQLESFPLLLERAGYRTAFIGKWHMGSDDAPRPGFTRWLSFAGQGHYRDQELNSDGQKISTQGYVTDVLSSYAVDFVREAALRPEPFLLYLSHKAVHEPFTPPPRHEGLYADAVVSCSRGCDDSLVGKPALTRFVPDTAVPVPGRGGPTDQQIRNQASLLASVDQGFGDVVRALQRAGVVDQTMIVFTSDNGYFHGEHSLGDKRWAYEESIRVPWIVRYPPLAAQGVAQDALVLNIDLAPTILDLAGVAVPPEVDGRSLRPLLGGESAPWRVSFVAEYFEEAPFPRVPTWEALRTEDLKLIRYPDYGDEFDELYDLSLDPFELVNQFTNEEYSSRVHRLQGLLDDILATIPDNRR